MDTTTTTTTTSTKRLREVSDDEEESNFGNEYPDTKRVRRVSAEDYLFNILDDEDDYSAASQDIDDGDGLASVMHSLEQEIFSSTGSESEHTPTGGCNVRPEVSVQELGYLLEASDDELGLPPAAEEEEEEEEAQIPSPAVLARDVAELAGADVVEAGTMYGQIWGFDDEIGNGFGSDIGFGFRPESDNDGFVGVVGFDDVGLFDHSEPSDLTWRTMPAA